MEFQFEVNLIVVADKQTHAAKQSIEGNCTHVTGNVYLMEGDLGSLLDDGAVFNHIDIGVVGALGGLTEKKKIALVNDIFGVDPTKLEFKESEIYFE